VSRHQTAQPTTPDHPDCRAGRPTARAERPCRAWVTMSASSAGWVPTVLQGPPHRLDHLPLDAVPERQREMRQVPESGVDSTASFSTRPVELDRRSTVPDRWTCQRRPAGQLPRDHPLGQAHEEVDLSGEAASGVVGRTDANGDVRYADGRAPRAPSGRRIRAVAARREPRPAGRTLARRRAVVGRRAVGLPRQGPQGRPAVAA